ncbi:MAG: protein translocase subunit SecF [Gemmatimonadota bacterium]|nr:MAG: protein translocase subunit SecF [Gemmatimonadota bacterium]
MRFFKETHIDFIGKRRQAFVLSSVLILIGLISLAIHGGPKFGIDFIEGTLLELHFEPPVTTAELRAALNNVEVEGRQLDFSSSEIQVFSDHRDVLLKVEEREKGTSVAEAIKTKLRQTFPDRIPPNEEDWLRRQEKVGPKIGGELKQAAVVAILVSLLLILIYISWRFQFRFAVAAIVALFHDVLITVGAFSVLGKEISLVVVAALLTIVGYSLNDTIVVSDRIRENIKTLRREKFPVLVNTSINQTLSRTVLTAGTTFLVVLVLFIKGGEVIHNFAFALLVGILIGTYSSIFVVSPILVEWHNYSEKKKRTALKRR